MQLKEFKDGSIVRTRMIDPSTKNRLTFGRASHNDYPIGRGNAACSRVQATLIKHGSDWLLLDGSDDKVSQNGVFLNGKRISGPLLLQSGLEVDLFLGDTEQIKLVNVTDDLTESVNVFDSNAIAQLRAEIMLLQDRINSQDVQIESIQKINSDLVSSLKDQIADHLEILSQDLRRALREAEKRNHFQDEQLSKHNAELNIHRIVLAVAVAAVCGWNATKANDQLTTIVNISGAMASLAAGSSQVLRPRSPQHATIPTLSELS